MKKIFDFGFLTLFICLLSLVIGSFGVPIEYAVCSAISIELVLGFVQSKTGKNICFATVCGGISNDILFNCDIPLQGGTRDRAVIINLDDIDGVTVDGANPLLITGITLKATKQAYQIDGRNNSIMPVFNMIKNAFTDTFDHIVSMKGFDISPAVKQNLTGIISGKFVVITENVYKGVAGNSAFEMYGLSVGLELTVLTRDPNNVDTQGAFDFTFATNKNKEATMPHTFFLTSYATTKALVDGLLTP